MAISDRGELVIRVTIACGVLELVAVVLRVLARWRSKAAFAVDDWCIVATLIPSFGMLAVGTLMVTMGGAGNHAASLTATQMTRFLSTVSAALITYSLTMTMVKISLLLLYRRIFSTRAFKRVAFGVGLVVFCWGLAAMLALIFQCRPISGMWTPSMQFTDKCIDIKAYYMGIATTNMLLDITVLCLPLYMVWTLQLRARQKIMLSGIFLLGSITCLASLMRIATISLVKGGDFPYTVTTPYVWSQIEAATAIVCACLTTYRPLFHGLSLRSLSSLSWSRSTHKEISTNSSRGFPSNTGTGNSRSRTGGWTASQDIRSPIDVHNLDDFSSRNTHRVDMDKRPNRIVRVDIVDVNLEDIDEPGFKGGREHSKGGSEDSLV